MNYEYDNDSEEIKIYPVGLINLSRHQKIKNYNVYKKLNLYNTCYINASIQCLFRLDEFVKNILKCDKGDLVLATKNLINSMNSKYNKNRQCAVHEIKQAMGEKDEIYKYEEQQDANEFISNYLNDLIEETNNTGNNTWKYLENDKIFFCKFYDKFINRKGNSFILDLFYGLLRTENYCKNCKHIFSIKFNSYNIIELPITEYNNNSQTLDLRVLLHNYISERKSKNEVCSVCKNEVTIKTSLYSLPRCLIIYFNRGSSNEYINRINIQKSINLENYIYDKSLNDDGDFFYHLKGIVFYSDFSKKIGHFKSACLVNNEKWYYFDDNTYETDKDLLRIYENENPSILFYEK